MPVRVILIGKDSPGVTAGGDCSRRIRSELQKVTFSLLSQIWLPLDPHMTPSSCLALSMDFARLHQQNPQISKKIFQLRKALTANSLAGEQEVVTGLRNAWATKLSGHWAVSAVFQFSVTLEESPLIQVLLNWNLVIVQAQLMFILRSGYFEQSPGQRRLQRMAH